MMEKLQTVILVSLLTLMIWLYAEAQNHPPAQEQEVDLILLPSNAESSTVRLESADRLRIEMTGPNAALATISDQLRQQTLELRLGEHGLPSEPGKYREPLLEYLQQLPLFSDSRARIIGVTPSVIEFSVQRLVNQTLEVESGPFGSVETEGRVTITPSSVESRLSEALLGGLTSDNLRAIATPRFSPGKIYHAGEEYTVDAVLSVPGIADQNLVTLEPNRVRITFTVRSTRVEYVVSNVPIHIVIPPVDQNRYDIELEESLIAEIRIAGPEELIQRVRDRDLRITGQAVFSSDELTRSITTIPISFAHLPDAIEILTPALSAKITINRRESPKNE